MKCFLSVCALILLVAYNNGCMYNNHKREAQRQAKRSLQMAKISSEVRDSLYLVIDLSEGINATFYPTSTLSSAPVDGWSDEYKTTKLVLRRIEAGTFMMGSPDDEPWRTSSYENLHEVTLTKPYYIGVFEVTQKQWELVMGNDPSRYKGDARPVERVSYNMIRGTDEGAQWPASAEVDAISFMGQLRTKTGIDFDLPTEAQWEYACRAGTTTALNSGKGVTSLHDCPNMAEVGRNSCNLNDGHGEYSGAHTTVGSYLPNAWGLYDMHGNVWEWCLDWSSHSLRTGTVTDPVGAASGASRSLRGVAWNHVALPHRSALRSSGPPEFNTVPAMGLRLAFPNRTAIDL